jgi:ABC-2 type transport system permease protein
VSASVAAQLFPAPSSQQFWSDASSAIREARPDRDSDAWRRVELQVISQALGRTVTAEEVKTMEFNRPGLYLAIAETLGAETYAQLYEQLFNTYQLQMNVRRWMALLSPTTALGHLSSALSGTDIATHRDFARQAEQQRQLIVGKMNGDMMVNGAGQGFEYTSKRDFWSSIPNFVYQPPPASFALAQAAPDFILLFFWTAAITCLARRVTHKHTTGEVLK